ncbi:WYL domain-containing protein [Candidatus Dependentiae bacterium]|nr:WYL domain-containing protein [Candidatus Dependentiae bacterium]
MTWKLFGNLLLDKSYISNKILDSALAEQSSSGEYLGDILLENRDIRDLKLNLVLNEQLNLSVCNIDKYMFLPLEELQFTIIDALTTGINYDQGARLCEFSMIKVKGDTILSKTRKIVKLDNEFPILLQNVFESADKIKSAKKTLEYFKPIMEHFVSGEIVIGFSLAFLFDFIFKQLNNKFKFTNTILIDIITLWRRLNPGPGHSSISFTKFTKTMGLEVVPPYSSLNNCIILHQIFIKLISEFKAAGINNLEALLNFQDRNFYFGIKKHLDIPSEIKKALDEKKVIEIEYYSPWTQERTIRKLDPYELIFRADNAYLLGYCHLRRDFRTFRLDRIGKIVVSHKKFINRKKPRFWV